MANTTQKFRIPNLPSGPLVNEEGYPTPAELTFRESLLTLLQNFIGNEGLVMPNESGDNITLIQNNSFVTPGTTNVTYTCQFGTMIYQNDAIDPSTAVKVAVDDGTGVPVFKTVTLT